ncbi:MAG TPA: hypothetical protein VJ385_12200 [Fibrobacteria bacterium]|nr:hypothetical protein [Fibrobacteria bacterium]
MDASGEGKSHRALAELMLEISKCRADIVRRENLVSDLQRRLLAELRPLEEKVLEVRLDIFRILGRHLISGRLNRRACKALELALLELAHDLEKEYGLDLQEDRNRFFETEFPPDEEEEESSGEEGRDWEDEWGNPHADGSGGPGPRSNGTRGGSGPESRAQRKQEQRDESIAGDIRALYLMLARALHPDKESDPSRLAEKTAWMQKVTAAYAARDLARLLDILATNPLDAVGPYLSQAPLKTVQGFAKRLRRELDALRTRLADLDWKLDPFLQGFIKGGKVNETAYNAYVSAVKKELRFRRRRRDAYRTMQGLEGLLEMLRSHPWNELM